MKCQNAFCLLFSTKQPKYLLKRTREKQKQDFCGNRLMMNNLIDVQLDLFNKATACKT